MDQEQPQPYKASLIDRFNSRVEKLPVRAWVFFAASGVVLILVQVLFLWLESGLQDTQLLPVILFNGLFTPFLLALINLLDNQAVAALDAMAPVLDTTASERERYQYMLSHMPGRATLAIGVAMVVLVILMEQLSGAPASYAALDQLRFFPIVFQIVDKSSAFLFGILIYHTIRQLRLVNAINANHVRVTLFNLGPLQAFSRLTASTAIGLVVGVYGWMLINPELFSDPVILGLVGFITILAVAVFVWPLWGVHRRLEAEKERRLRALDEDLEAAFAGFNRAFRDDDQATSERLNGTIASLDIQRRRIAEIPTWPWRSETAQFVFAAIALPSVLAILQFLVEQALD